MLISHKRSLSNPCYLDFFEVLSLCLYSCFWVSNKYYHRVVTASIHPYFYKVGFKPLLAHFIEIKNEAKGGVFLLNVMKTFFLRKYFLSFSFFSITLIPNQLYKSTFLSSLYVKLLSFHHLSSISLPTTKQSIRVMQLGFLSS